MRIVLYLSFALLPGCATKLQPAPVFEIPIGSKVGVINYVTDTMNHYHVGTTVLNNFKKEYNVAWDIPGFINSEIKRRLNDAGYEAVFIDPPATSLRKSDVTFIDANMQLLKPNYISELERISNKYNIDMLYVIEPTTGMLLLPNVQINVEGYGVGTRNVLAMGSASSFAMIDASAICLNPISLTRGASSRGAKDISGLKMIGNFRELSASDLEKSKDAIIENVEIMISKLIENSIQ